MSSFEPQPTVRAATSERFVAAPLGAAGVGFSAAPGAVARSVVESPAIDLETVRLEAYAAGQAAGRAELPWTEAETLRSAFGALEEALRALTALRRGYLVDNRTAVLDLAFAIAEQLLGRAIRTRPDAVAELLARALPLVADEDPVHVRLSTRDLDALRAGEAPALARLVEAHALTIEADPALEPGEGRVLAGRTRVDARLGEVLRRLREEMSELAESTEEAS